MKNINNEFVNDYYIQQGGKYTSHLTLIKFGRLTNTHGPSLSMQPTLPPKSITPAHGRKHKSTTQTA